jgi:hypothetical protein
MAQLLALFNQILTGGIGGVAFLGAWAYMVIRWLGGTGLGGFHTIKLPIPWLW